MPTIFAKNNEFECSERALLIAKALHACTNYPGRSIAAAEWPPNRPSTLSKYVKMGKFVEAALLNAGNL